MKKKNKLLSLATKALGLALVFSMALSFCAPLHVEAKKIKTIKLTRDTVFSNDIDYVNSIATTVKKGTYKTKIQTKRGSTASEAFIRFVAPTTKTYSITVSDLRTNNTCFTCGIVSFRTPDYNLKFVTNRYDAVVKGDKDGVLRIHSNKDTSGGYAPKKTAKIHLNEGETLYIHYNVAFSRPSKYIKSKISIK